MMAPAGTTHTIKPEHSGSPLWNVIKALGNKCFYFNGTQWVDTLDESYLEYYLKHYDAVTHETIPTETPEEAEAFNKMKPYEFDEHVSGEAGAHYKDDTQHFGEDVPKVPSEKMKVALRDEVTIEGDNGDKISYTTKEIAQTMLDKPVFTQAMADRNELPPVGSSVMVAVHGRGDFKAVVIGSHQRWVWLDVEGIGLDTFDLVWVHAVDTRTPKQKAVDAVMGEWPIADKSTLEIAYDLWNK
ncbi:hypothetical protein S141_23 [Shewanella sp. phage 1/41]|uniref:hypothetical protein n=1 Tax=Shewanella sp. phage 1/41 TaxID=1458861 RepID=UPI0004F8B98C|nr:hypothetical protein S141_23 [Shewanella sp. phage 1/41]AHK11669.1 hypothetical protein S141_23 [Shewanella sp. phage 1/41]